MASVRAMETSEYLLHIQEPAEDNDFRTFAVKVLAERFGAPGGHLSRPPDFGVKGGADAIEAGRSLLAALADGGWATPSWPLEHGGAGLTGTEVAIFREELGRYDLPSLNPFIVGLSQVGPAIIRHGTDEQQARWVHDIRSGQSIWCQLFSEPNAGSDLANVQAAAIRDEARGGWQITGQKVWSSRSSYADLGFLVARTDSSGGKHAGLTVFGLRMHQPGVEVRPLRQMNGDAHFCEVFLDNAFVHDTDRIGETGHGWTVAMTTLMHERSGAGTGLAGGGTRPLLDLARQMLGSDTVPRDRVVQAVIAIEVNRLLTTRLRQAVAAGATPGAEGSLGKLGAARGMKAVAAAVAALLGPQAVLAGHDWEPLLLTAPSLSIRGGTDEILKNVVGERVLGLPRDPR